MAHTFTYKVKITIPCGEHGTFDGDVLKGIIQQQLDPIMGEVTEVTQLEETSSCGDIAGALPAPPITIWDKNRKEFKRIKGGDAHGH